MFQVGPGPGPSAEAKTSPEKTTMSFYLCFEASFEAKFKFFPDCHLRQGDGGTKTACFGSNTCFLNQFHNGSTYFSASNQNNTIKLQKNVMFCF